MLKGRMYRFRPVHQINVMAFRASPMLALGAWGMQIIIKKCSLLRSMLLTGKSASAEYFIRTPGLQTTSHPSEEAMLRINGSGWHMNPIRDQRRRNAPETRHPRRTWHEPPVRKREGLQRYISSLAEHRACESERCVSGVSAPWAVFQPTCWNGPLNMEANTLGPRWLSQQILAVSRGRGLLFLKDRLSLRRFCFFSQIK